MKGQDIVVIDTPRYNEMVYKLFAAHIGVDVNATIWFMEENNSYRYASVPLPLARIE